MKRHPIIVYVIFLIFFITGFLISILGPVIPDIIDSFQLSIALAGFLPFSLFVAFAIVSIPTGILIEKFSEKPVILLAFSLALIGALLFVLLPSFIVALLSLFLIGICLAMLQVTLNPLLRQAGGEEHFAFNSVLVNVVFGVASFTSPLLYSYLVENIHTANTNPFILLLNSLVAENLKWISLYWVVAIVVLLMLLLIKSTKFPKVELKENEKIDTQGSFKKLLHNKIVILFFIGVVAYVGTEQGITNWTSKFLQTYHGIDPTTTGASVVAYFWGLLTIGSLVGLVLLKLFDSRIVLLIFTIGAIISLAFALYGSANMAIIAFPLTGFFASVIWPVINSLALNSIGQHHGTFSGILYSGIGGGAIVLLLIGGIGELVGLQFGMSILFVTLGYILNIAFWAKPLVKNATLTHWSNLFKISHN